MTDDVKARYDDALRSLDELLADRPPVVYDAIERATVDVVAVRDELIEAARAGNTDHGDALRRVNALLSLIVSAEFPLGGVRWKRIQSARDDLAKLAGGEG